MDGLAQVESDTSDPDKTQEPNQVTIYPMGNFLALLFSQAKVLFSLIFLQVLFSLIFLQYSICWAFGKIFGLVNNNLKKKIAFGFVLALSRREQLGLGVELIVWLCPEPGLSSYLLCCSSG